MNYGIITIGSRGDIEPFIALGKGLIKRGHHVRIAAFSIFKDDIESNGFEYSPLAGKPILRSKLNADNFASAIYQATHDQRMIEQSKVIGSVLRAENGVEHAIQIIEQKTAANVK